MRSTSLWKALLLGSAVVIPVSTTAGCDGGSGDECQSARTYFEQDVWGTFMGTKCAKCHTPDGVAVAEKGAKFVLQPSSYPGFLDANLKMIEDISRVDVDGKPIILVKPTGGDSHGGGTVLEPGSEEYNALQTLVDKIKNPPSCDDSTVQSISGVTLMSPQDTFRKAAINLAGRLPTVDEEKKITTDDALLAGLDGLMKETIFLDRMREMFNDSLLTNRFDRGGDALYIISDQDFPKIKEIRDSGDYSNAQKRAISRAIAREPLNLVAYVTQQDRPFTEILTAPYVVANPFNGVVYGATGFKDPTNENEFQELQLQTYADAGGVAVPHAGILTTPAFLSRWPTTPTNRDRGRARQVFKSFLAFNVLTISGRPIDATKVTAVDNPTMNSQFCNVCHTTIDPTAGTFRGWNENGNYAHFNKDADWHNDMLEAGFNGVSLPPDQYNTGLPWLASQIVKDPRFAIAVVHTVYTGITGHEPLPFPSDKEAKDYDSQMNAWDAQDAFFRSTVDALVKNKWNVKEVVKAVVMSPYFRAESATNKDAAELADIGTGHLLTPEQLNRKIKAVTGVYWGYFDGDHNRYDMLDKDTYQNYFIFYGGMDSDSVISHLKQPNGTVAAVAGRMANEMACSLTAWDFTKSKETRRLFPLVDRTIVPESAGNEVPASVQLIKENIAYLHHLLLGENLKPDAAEVNRTYQVFLETWRELDKAGDNDLQWWCMGRWDRATGLDLPEDQMINDDPDKTIRAWQAVIAYLMMDYRFIYE